MLTLFFHYTFSSSGGNTQKTGLGLGFDVDMEPQLWWQRKPKALAPAVARARLYKVAKCIVEKAQQQADRREPEAQRRAEVKEAVAPLLAQMPGFDWRAMYQEAYDRAISKLIAAQRDAQDQDRKREAEESARRGRIDEEDVSLLIALI